MYVEQEIDEATREVEVVLTLSRADAVKLFHSINRTLAVLDDLRAEAPRWMPPPDEGDQAAYDGTNDFISQLQRELQIEPEVNAVHP